MVDSKELFKDADDLVSRLRALARAEHDDLSVGDEAADMIVDIHKRLIDWFETEDDA